MLLSHKSLLNVPLLIVFDSEEVLRVVSASHYLSEVLKNILNHHAENAIILVPEMFES